MSIVIGVVGPHDLVDEVAATCEEQPGVSARRLDYDHESQAPAIVEAHAGQVEAWLFTGVVPYTLAREAEVLTRPATFVDYTGATLLQAAVRLLRAGHDVTRISIDTLTGADVSTTFAEAGLPVDRVRSLPYRSGLNSADVVAFHRRQRRAGAAVAVTCISSVHEALRDELPVFRLAPSNHSVRTALRQLLLYASSQAQEDAQIALGLACLPDGDGGLLKEVAALGGTLARFGGDTHLIVTTRGPLHDATAGFTALPMLRRLADRHDTVQIGFGLGRSAAEAENLARRALSRARRVGAAAAVLSLRGDTDIVLESTTAPPPVSDVSLAVIAQRVGLSVPTLLRLREVRHAVGGEPLTSREVADQLNVQQRTARRMLHRLELAGLAERTGNLSSGTSGRPLTLYRLTL
ncbi:hypothetical protein ONA91_32815 [Micromonospora sp. DR5-3]|uniref:hypothetical protein n=1 Tax=unclassified Micromonospora TaxID=2617518 RepID=UPI0011D7D615|nr:MULTISPECIES: hypothetical protein [unclassified Micromonospora]MCW3819235.1 hypothetical protein [Micromonospora sp. DR5-3]TYC20985.1 hypothetical protein FXF52_28480 [Micromonospora sp. MP36]